MSERNPIQIGDTVRHNEWWPIFPDVKVISIGVCGDGGCNLDTVGFLDPESGDYDEAHMAEFHRVEVGNAVP